MDRRNFTLSFLSACTCVPSARGLLVDSTGSKESSMQNVPFVIDPRAHPDQQFRIDAFTVPQASRTEFEAAMRRNLAFLQTLPGFIGHMVFEKTNGPTTFNIVTIAIWESQEAITAAGDKVHAYYQRIGFDLRAMLVRLGVTASLGYYHAPVALQ